LVVFENEWRRYRGRRRTYATEISLEGTDDFQTIVLDAQDFQQAHRDGQKDTKENLRLSKWGEMDRLEIRAYYDVLLRGEAKKIGTSKWQRPQPELKEIRWVLD